MGVSTLYLGDSKLADKQVSAWARNELKNEKIKAKIVKNLYNGLLDIKKMSKKSGRRLKNK